VVLALRWARIGLAAVLALLSFRALREGQPYIPLLSDIDLAIHEFGHILWSPFGETMAILGGSLTQIVFPAIFVGYFLRAREGRRDWFAALVCCWWVGLNVIEVSIYVNDARAGELMLLNGLTGQESDAHDWYNLLARWGALQSDHAIAATMRRLAVLILAGSVIGAAAAGWRLRSAPSASPDRRFPR
jgi:hypothetical protein